MKTIPIDPRTALVSLVLVNIASFSGQSVYSEFGLLTALFVFMVCCRCILQAVKLTLLLSAILLLQHFVFPHTHRVFVSFFAMLSIYIRKLIPCLMLAAVIMKRIPLRYLVLAMRKWRFPESLIISLSIALRYFPAIKNEATYITDAMKLRDIKGLARVESLVVPLMVSATNTAEELSAAAVTRGIENPVRKTSVIEIGFRLQDYIMLVSSLAFTLAILVLPGA